MEEEEVTTSLSRKELRKLKLTEYLAAKGRLKAPNPRPYLREDPPGTRTVSSAPPVDDVKENKAPPNAGGGTGLKGGAAGPGSGPAGSKPAGSRPVGSRSVGSGLAGSKPAGSRPAGSKPAGSRSVGSGLAGSKPAGSKPAGSKPAGSRPVGSGLAGSRPAGSRPAGSEPEPVRKVLSVSNNVNVRGGVAGSQKNPSSLAPTSRLAQLRRNQNPEPTRTDTAAAAGVKKQPDAGLQRSVRAPHPTLAAKPGSCKSTSWRPTTTTRTSSRVSLGPLVKTRTGLTPAVSQPGYAAPTGVRTSTSAVPANKAPSRTQPPPRPSSKARVRTGFKPAPARAAPQPADRPAKPRSAADGGRAAAPNPAAAARDGSRAASRRPPAAETGKEQNRPAKVRTGAPAASQTVPRPVRTISFTGHGANTRTPEVSAKPRPQTEGKRGTAAQEDRMRKLQEWRRAKGISYKRPSMPAPAPLPATRRTASVSGPFWTSMKEEDEAQTLIRAVDRSLADCLKLLEEGCPPDRVGGVLSRLPAVSRKFTKFWTCRARLMEREGNLDVLPLFQEAVRVVAEPVDELRTVVFEILKRRDEARAASEENDHAGGGTPPRNRGPDATLTPKPVRALIWGQNGDSSVIKYKITATPGGAPSHKRESTVVDGQEVRFFTPVRRSVRIQRGSGRYPAALRDHDPCVASYHDLFSEDEEEDEGEEGGAESGGESGEAAMYVYRENRALEDKVVVQLVCGDSP